MITILEGTDGVGKTSIASAMAARRGARYLHADRPTAATWWDEYVAPLQGAGDVVVDRWHLGEIVWPEVFGRPSLFNSEADFEACCRELGRMGAELTVVVRDERDIAAVLEARGEGETVAQVLAGQRLFIDRVRRVVGMPVSIATSPSLWGN